MSGSDHPSLVLLSGCPEPYRKLIVHSWCLFFPWKFCHIGLRETACSETVFVTASWGWISLQLFPLRDSSCLFPDLHSTYHNSWLRVQEKWGVIISYCLEKLLFYIPTTPQIQKSDFIPKMQKWRMFLRRESRERFSLSYILTAQIRARQPRLLRIKQIVPLIIQIRNLTKYLFFLSVNNRTFFLIWSNEIMSLTSLHQYRAAVQQTWMPVVPFKQYSEFLVSLFLHDLGLPWPTYQSNQDFVLGPS